MKIISAILLLVVLLQSCINDQEAKLELASISVEKANNLIEWIEVENNSMQALKIEEQTLTHTYSCTNKGSKIASDVVLTCFIILTDGNVKVYKQKVRNIAPNEILYIDIPIKTKADSLKETDVVIDWK